MKSITWAPGREGKEGFWECSGEEEEDVGQPESDFFFFFFGKKDHLTFSNEGPS